MIELDIQVQPWPSVFNGIEHRAFKAGPPAKVVTLKAPLWTCQWLLENDHATSGIWASPTDGGGVRVRMATGDFILQPVLTENDFVAEWIEVYYGNELVERLRMRCAVDPATGKYIP